MEQIVKYFENWQIPSQLQRRETMVSIAAATATVVTAGALYSLVQKVYNKLRFIERKIVRRLTTCALFVGFRQSWLQNRSVHFAFCWIKRRISKESSGIHGKMDKRARSSIPCPYFRRGKIILYFLIHQHEMLTASCYQVMTIVSGPYVREIFLNNDFNFIHGTNKASYMRHRTIEQIH